MGYLLKWDAAGKTTLEADTLACSHCQKVLLKHLWKQDGAWCWQCGHGICSQCHHRSQTEGCAPFMKKVEQAISRQKLFSTV